MATPFQEYPKAMSHPHHAAAVYEQLPGKGTGLFAPDTVCRKPERFPPVTVFTLAQEQSFAAKGYRPNNMPDPDAYEQAILDAQPEGCGGFQAYPKWKYSKTEVPLIVKNEQEETALGDGWYDAPVEATEDDLTVEEQQASSPADETQAKTVDKRSREYRESVGRSAHG